MLSVPHPAGLLLSLPAWLQVFYLDSLKFFLSLYGHKLPVLCMDISSDSTLLVSGSADKNIKVGFAGLHQGRDASSAVSRAGRVQACGTEPCYIWRLDTRFARQSNLTARQIYWRRHMLIIFP